MSVTLYHVSPASNIESILSLGLLANPPQRNFDCGYGVYVTDSIEQAYRWAGEIARQRGEVTEMALVGIDALAANSGAWVMRPTEIPKTKQALLRKDLPVHALQVLETFAARPMRNKKRQEKFAHSSA